MSAIPSVDLYAAVGGVRWLPDASCLSPSPVRDAWILHRHRAGARKVRRVLRRHERLVQAQERQGWKWWCES